MTPDYSPRYYQYNGLSLNRKRQLIDKQLALLHEMHIEMIEQALAHSDMQQAKEVIQWIMVK